MAKSAPQSNTLISALPPDLNSFSDGIDTQTLSPAPVVQSGVGDGAIVPDTTVPPPPLYRPDADPLLIDILEELEQLVVGQLFAPYARRHWVACDDLMNRVRERVKA